MGYENSKIYLIRNYENDKLYVGSTNQTLSKRFSKHVTNRHSKLYPIYQAMNDIGIEKFYIELVEPYPCENIEQRRSREQHWIRFYNTYNTGYNGRNEIVSPDYARQYNQTYQRKNTQHTKDINKQWRQANAEHVKQYNREYKLKNAERISQYNKEKKLCEVCNVYVSRSNLASHRKRLTHTKNLETGNECSYETL